METSTVFFNLNTMGCMFFNHKTGETFFKSQDNYHQEELAKAVRMALASSGTAERCRRPMSIDVSALPREVGGRFQSFDGQFLVPEFWTSETSFVRFLNMDVLTDVNWIIDVRLGRLTLQLAFQKPLWCGWMFHMILARYGTRQKLVWYV